MQQPKKPYAWYGFTVDEEAREFRFTDNGQLHRVSFDTREGANLYAVMMGRIQIQKHDTPSGPVYIGRAVEDTRPHDEEAA